MTPEKLYKIGEVMKFSGLSRQTIHNYTMLGLIEPVSETDSGHRLYSEEVFVRLEKIKRYKLHRTLREVKAILDQEKANRGSASVESGETQEN